MVADEIRATYQGRYQGRSIRCRLHRCGPPIGVQKWPLDRV